MSVSGPGFQRTGSTEGFASVDMAEHPLHPDTTDFVSDRFGPFQKPVCWQLDAMDVCHLDPMAQGA